MNSDQSGRVSSPNQDALMELVEVTFRIRPKVSMWHRSGTATKVELSWDEFKALSLAALSAHASLVARCTS